MTTPVLSDSQVLCTYVIASLITVFFTAFMVAGVLGVLQNRVDAPRS